MLEKDPTFEKIAQLIKTLGQAKLGEYLEQLERGQLLPQKETISQDKVATETYGRFYKKQPNFLFAVSDDKPLKPLENAVLFSIQRLRGRKLVPPVEKISWWQKQLEDFSPGVVVVYTDPPMSEFILADRLIYRKINADVWSREIIYCNEIPDPFLYPGIRNDIAVALGVDNDQALHGKINAYLDMCKAVRILEKQPGNKVKQNKRK